MGFLNAVSVTPCGSTEPTTCRMMPPLPAESIACSTSSTEAPSRPPRLCGVQALLQLVELAGSRVEVLARRRLAAVVPGRGLGIDVGRARSPRPTRSSSAISPVQCFSLLWVMEPIMARTAGSARQRNLDELPAADRRGERLVERGAGRDALVLPAVRERELLEPRRCAACRARGPSPRSRRPPPPRGRRRSCRRRRCRR